MRCPKCGGYEWNEGICKFCGYMPKAEPAQGGLGMVDVFKLAEGLAAKEKRDKPVEIDKSSKLRICPKCGLQTLMYNKFANKDECLNKYCPKRNRPTLSEELNDYFLHSHEE